MLYQERFDGGSAGDWRLAAGWATFREPDGNWVLRGQGHYWAQYAPGSWGDYTFGVRVKLVRGGIHINYRVSGCIRYFIGFAERELYLNKTSPCGNQPRLSSVPADHRLGRWYELKVVGKGSKLDIYVDGVLKMTYVDPERLVYGTIALETLPDSEARVDDIIVVGQRPPSLGLEWVRTGAPLGGIGYDVRIDPTNTQILYVTDAWSGVSKSENAGSLWAPSNKGIISRTGPSGDAIPVFSLTVDPKNPNTLWAGTQGMRGVYKSTDGGLTWVKSDYGIPDLEGITFRSFTIDPLDSNIVYASTEVPTRQKGPDGQNEVGGKIYRTTDGGKNWGEILDTGALVRWMAIDPTDPRILYAATGIFDRDDVRSEGVLKSTDGGRTWRNINNGLTNLTVGGLVMEPRNPKVLYAATGRHNGFGGGPTAAFGGVFKTTDGGETWAEVLHRPSDYFPVTAIALAPSNPDIVYVAPSTDKFYRSKDGGKTWESFPLDPDGASVGIPIAVSVDPHNPNIVYINSYIGGVFKSTDGGETWHIASQGYTGAQLTEVGMDPHNPSVVYAIGRQGVARSERGGEGWVYLNRGPAGHGFTEGAGLSVNPRNPQEALAASRFDGRILRTTNGGARWQQVFDAVPHDHYPDNLHGLVQFARFQGDPNIIYAAGRMATETMQINRRTRSIGVLKSTDGGQRWQAVNTGLIPDLNINTVAVHPTNADIAYAGALNGGVYQTTDGGAHWQQVGGNFASDVRALAVDPQNLRVLYAGVEGGGVYKSSDGGATWQPSGAGMDPQSAIRSIVIDPTNPQIIYAADIHTGVYRSEDGGSLWLRIDKGLRTRAVNALAISADGGTLYAATEGEGVFRLDILPLPGG